MTIQQAKRIQRDILKTLPELYHDNIMFTIYETAPKSGLYRVRIDAVMEGRNPLFNSTVTRAIIEVAYDHPEHEMIFATSHILETPKVIFF